MTSHRHTREAEEAYLDAARASILDLGWRRTTLTEVARRAGVSRMTIYRTWSDMPSLLSDLMTREWSAIVSATGTDTAMDAGTDPGGLVTRMVATVRALRRDELFLRIVELDPELVLPYLLSRRGRSQDLVLAILEDAVGRGQANGRVRAGRPAAIARGLVLAAHGFVLSAHTMVDDTVSEDDLDAELTLVLTRVLAP